MDASFAGQMHLVRISGLPLNIAEGSRIVHTETLAMPGGKVPAQQMHFSVGSLTRSIMVMHLVAMGGAELGALLIQRYQKIRSWKSGEIIKVNVLP